ncbi:MAG: MIP/aquaporin family protein [Pseudomonadota bacterium]
MSDLPRRLAAEAMGAAFLLAGVIGSGVMAADLAGEAAAVALLANTIPTGAILYVLIIVFGPISGAHFNPAVSLVFALRGELSAVETTAYGAAQIVGGLLGMLAAHAMFGLDLGQVSSTVRAGPSQWFAEVVATFGLILAILATVRHRPDAVAAVVGFYITAAYWFTASTSFANPAVTVARMFTDTFAGIRPADAPPFIAAQLVGAALAFAFCHWLFAPQRPSKEAPKRG